MKFPYFKLPNPDPKKKSLSVPWIPVSIRAHDNVGGHEIKTIAGFIDGNLIDGKIAGVLGRQGLFDHFKVCIDEKKKEIELKPM